MGFRCCFRGCRRGIFEGLEEFLEDNVVGRDRDLVGTPILYNRGFPSLLLDEKGRKNQGQHHRTSPQSGRFSAMSAVARAPYPACFWRSHVVGNIDVLERHREGRSDPENPLYNITITPWSHRGLSPSRGMPEGQGVKPAISSILYVPSP